MKLILELSDKAAKQMYIHHKELLKDRDITPSLWEFSRAYCVEYIKNINVDTPKIDREFPLLEKDHE